MGKTNEIRELDGEDAIVEITEVLEEADLDFIYEVYKMVCTSGAVMNEKETKIIVEEWE